METFMTLVMTVVGGALGGGLVFVAAWAVECVYRLVSGPGMTAEKREEFHRGGGL